MERTVGGKHREVYINRLHWMTARLCREGVIEALLSLAPFPGPFSREGDMKPPLRRLKTQACS